MTAAVSVVAGAAPSLVVIVGLDVPTAKALLKLVTSVLAVVLVKVRLAPEAVPDVQPLGAPAVNVPLAASLKAEFKEVVVEFAAID